MAGGQIDESAVIVNSPVPEKSGQQREHVIGKRAVEIWFLESDGFRRTACREAVALIGSRMNNRRK